MGMLHYDGQNGLKRKGLRITILDLNTDGTTIVVPALLII